ADGPIGGAARVASEVTGAARLSGSSPTWWPGSAATCARRSVRPLTRRSKEGSDRRPDRAVGGPGGHRPVRGGRHPGRQNDLAGPPLPHVLKSVLTCTDACASLSASVRARYPGRRGGPHAQETGTARGACGGGPRGTVVGGAVRGASAGPGGPE